jgi:hypothetical protein
VDSSLTLIFIPFLHRRRTLLKIVPLPLRFHITCLESMTRDYEMAVYKKDISTNYPENTHLTLHTVAVSIRGLPSTLVFSNLTF